MTSLQSAHVTTLVYNKRSDKTFYHCHRDYADNNIMVYRILYQIDYLTMSYLTSSC